MGSTGTGAGDRNYLRLSGEEEGLRGRVSSFLELSPPERRRGGLARPRQQLPGIISA